RVQRQTEQAALLHALVDRDHVRAEIEEKLFGAFSILLKQMDNAALLPQKEATRSVRNGSQRHGRANSLGDNFQTDVGSDIRLRTRTSAGSSKSHNQH